MSEGEDDDNINPACQEIFKPCFCLKILTKSLELVPRNKQIFLSILTLTTLPLSFFLFSFSLYAHPIKVHVYNLETLAQFAATHFEARHLSKESRTDALSLLRLRLSYFLPCYFLSLIAAITAVHSAHSTVNGKRASLLTAVNYVKLTWKRPLVTTICIYAVLVSYSQVIFYLTIMMGTTPRSGLLIWAIGSVLEVYVMAVLGVGLVVSVLEERFGFDAIRVGSDLMEGRRTCGWLLSGWFVLVSGLIGWRWEKLMMEGQYLRKQKWTAVMGSWEKIGLICLYGMEVLWGYVVTTIFYCECRKRHAIRKENDIYEETV